MMDWTNDYFVGVAQIDDQHKELFDRINKMLRSMKEGKGKEEVLNTIYFLEEYVIKHFRDEEELQRKTQYPKYMLQYQQHEKFKKDLKSIKDIVSKDGITITSIVQLQNDLNKWWRDHILLMDKDLGRHLKTIQY
ncbi:hemerythrin family protein [Mobilitalea sibirica]|uniref:Hemerythrin family protein n=1 Tax=Mobilitalea sibirica TaxID=1462919 RepID=A0A8J7H0F5_9FIRM|nr:hemerythrin family protein [Mobilitalea sibirica]MBH1939569.1 hemerythrin family protein [Mobilitalea sibirica]